MPYLRFAIHSRTTLWSASLPVHRSFFHILSKSQPHTDRLQVANPSFCFGNQCPIPEVAQISSVAHGHFLERQRGGIAGNPRRQNSLHFRNGCAVAFRLFPQPPPFSRFLIVAILATRVFGGAMIVEEQIYARQQRAAKAIQSILTAPVGNAYGDYLVKSASSKEYRVAMRGPSRQARTGNRTTSSRS